LLGVELFRQRVREDDATTLVPGQPISAQVSPTSEFDLYRFDLTAQRTVILQSTRTGGFIFTPCMETFSALEPVTPFLLQPDPSCGSVVRLEATIGAGTYFVKVADDGNDGTGSYQIVLQTF
jgi:hypothetical protein